MKIALMHYHLKPGGVTTVIKDQTAALKDDCDIAVFTGNRYNCNLPCDIIEIAGLGYDSEKGTQTNMEKTVRDLLHAIKLKWKNGCDILHIHNPTLKKNSDFLQIIELLKKEGINLLLQIHDFAEDGRPNAYFFEEYPANCHYAAINSRDYNFLLKSGLKKKGLHLIQNAVEPLNVESAQFLDENRVLYPVRGIRRKNLGEALLLSLFFKNNETLSFTLPPNSESDKTAYNNWKKFSAANKINAEFECGIKYDFLSLVKSAKFLISTSISEGFGFCFLEPWTAGKTVQGRKIADICSDFEDKGIDFTGMYNKLPVPAAWIGKDKLRSRVFKTIERCSKLYNFKIEKYRFADIPDFIDFGLLCEDMQKKVILRVLQNPKDKSRLEEINGTALNPTLHSANLIKKNRNSIIENYNREIYKNKLLKIYQSVIKEKVTQKIDKNILLSQFLNPETFSLLKWGEYAE